MELTTGRLARGLSNQVSTATAMVQYFESNPSNSPMPFRPGQSGNPNGRKPGSRNKRTLAAEQAIEVAATTDKAATQPEVFHSAPSLSSRPARPTAAASRNGEQCLDRLCRYEATLYCERRHLVHFRWARGLPSILLERGLRSDCAIGPPE